jgi:hypothetical protein
MQFKPDKPASNIEKQSIWNEWSKKVEKVTDGIGYPIDPGIKDSVVALNVFGIKTDGSCEGHLDRGLPYPWIDVPVISDELREEFSIAQENIAKKKYSNEEEFKKDDPIMYQKMMEIRAKHQEERNRVKSKIDILLSEFYNEHTPHSTESQIIPHYSPMGFRVELYGSRGLGLGNWKKYDDKIGKLSLKEKEVYLKNNQSEMKAFTGFLKNKFLNEK